ncbi:alpha-galactosidase [Puia sp. P3]|uniref:alpha-galactosidase n=1 Tax=Puia sp. P3 TaxID=3423952 RepID=UPI003D666848
MKHFIIGVSGDRRLVLVGVMALIFSLSGRGQGAGFHQWAPVPPMGWNSWDCYGPTVTEAEVKANADYMAAHLKPFGWNYIIVDIRWYVNNDKAHGYNESNAEFNIDEYGRYLPSVVRFPSAADGKGFRPLADYMHAKGLKLGVHVMRGVPVIAVKRALPVYGSAVTARDIYSEQGQCDWLHDNYTVDATKEGAQAYYNSLFKLFASWGLDFVKVDDLTQPYHGEELAMIRKAIDGCGRAIVLSTSPGETPVDQAKDVQAKANMWRTVGDFWDSWKQLKEHFTVFERWNGWRAAGAYPDGDMLPLGRIGIRAERGDPRMTKFTRDEQYTLMTLWAIFRSPMFFGGDLPANDSFTLSLLTNKAVMNVLKYSVNNRQLYHSDDLVAWVADVPKSGDKYLAVFNTRDVPGADSVGVGVVGGVVGGGVVAGGGNVSAPGLPVPVKLSEIGFDAGCRVVDLWTGKRLGRFSGSFAPLIRWHGAGLYRLSARGEHL